MRVFNLLLFYPNYDLIDHSILIEICKKVFLKIIKPELKVVSA